MSEQIEVTTPDAREQARQLIQKKMRDGAITVAEHKDGSIEFFKAPVACGNVLNAVACPTSRMALDLVTTAIEQGKVEL